jgi:hypothetical protein
VKYFRKHIVCQESSTVPRAGMFAVVLLIIALFRIAMADGSLFSPI